MRCALCAAELAAGYADRLCARCSLQAALGLSSGRPAPTEGLANYERIEEVGRGAMGIVWLARDRSLDRLVALKLIESVDPKVAERLLREGQAGARLRHPHIVAVHAMGGTQHGTYLAMDFLEGGSLEQALRSGPMNPRAAAELCAAIAGALGHAHGEGILHRDLKPSNILLDERGDPHLADFGLAAPREGGGDLTMAGQILGTPAYLAPELLDGIATASERSDLYGLGAVLYACVTGRAPFVAGSVAAVLEQVRSADPPAPRLLNPDVPRDLETIGLKCLQKSPAARYASAAEAEADLRRFLRGEPITARPVGRWERGVRWCRRNPALAAASGVAAVLLLVLAIGGPLAAWRVNRARAQAASDAATSKAISDFLENDLLAQAAPASQPDRDIRLRTVLDRAEQKIGGRFAGQPAVEASLRETLARTYWSLGDFAVMQKEAQQALALRRASGKADGPEALRLMSLIFVSLRSQGHYPQAEKWGLETLAADRRVFGPDAPDTLAVMNNLASLYLSAGRYADAEKLGNETLAIKRRVLGPADRSTLVTMTNLAMAENDLGQRAQAEALDREALASLPRVLGPEHPTTLSVMHNLAVVFLSEDKLAQAQPLAEKTWGIRQRVLGPDHPETLRTLNLLAEIAERTGPPQKAEDLLKSLVAARNRVLGGEHPDTLMAQGDLAAHYLARGRLAEAEDLDAATLVARRKVLGPNHPDTRANVAELAAIYDAEHRPADAARLRQTLSQLP